MHRKVFRSLSVELRALFVAWLFLVSQLFGPLSPVVQAQCVVPATGTLVITSSYSTLAADTGKLIFGECAAACTLTLPAIPPTSVWQQNVEVLGGFAPVTISPNGLNLDGQPASQTIMPGMGVEITTDGANYFIGGRGSFPTIFISNATSTGTTNAKLAKLTTVSNASVTVLTATTDVNGIAGIVVDGGGTSGSAHIARGGIAVCVFDGATTAGDIVVNSSSTAGDCHDAGASAQSAAQVIGRVTSTNASGGNYQVLVGTEGITPNLLSIGNAASTGTTVNTLTKYNIGAVIAATTDTGGIFGITIGGAGTGGNATIQTSGAVPCVFDAATTQGDYVQISATIAGNCHDAGSVYPTSGQVIGRIFTTNGSAGTYTIDLFGAEVRGSTGSGSGAITVISKAFCSAFTSNLCTSTTTSGNSGTISGTTTASTETVMCSESLPANTVVSLTDLRFMCNIAANWAGGGYTITFNLRIGWVSAGTPGTSLGTFTVGTTGAATNQGFICGFHIYGTAAAGGAAATLPTGYCAYAASNGAAGVNTGIPGNSTVAWATNSTLTLALTASISSGGGSDYITGLDMTSYTE